jgi:hypothetical protein
MGKTEATAQFWQAIAHALELSFPVVFHTQNCAVYSGTPTVSSVYCPHHDDIISRPSTPTCVPSNSFSRWASHDIYLSKYLFLLRVLRFLFFSSDNIMADVASKQHTTALLLSSIVRRIRRHTERTKGNWQIWWSTCVVPENIQFIFLHSLT